MKTLEQVDALCDEAKRLSDSAKRKILEDFSEFCHKRYKGCYQEGGEWNYSYSGEIIGLVEEYLK